MLAATSGRTFFRDDADRERCLSTLAEACGNKYAKRNEGEAGRDGTLICANPVGDSW